MKGYPSEIDKALPTLKKRGLVPEREYIAQIVTEWNVKPVAVKSWLRRGAGSGYVKHEWRITKARQSYLFVDPVSARKWLAFALDRIIVP